MRNTPCTRRQHVVGALVVVTALVVVGAALLLAFAAAPAHALSTWQHDSAIGCSVCHSSPGPVNAKCSFCHTNYSAAPGATCWECHQPGSSTAALRSSAACSSTCHLYSPLFKSYSIPYSHGATPHVGADAGACLDCHGLTVSVTDPGTSEHHAGAAVGPPTCEQCHNGTLASAKQTHDGIQCTDCHSGMDLPTVPATCNKCHAAATFGTGSCRDCHDALVHNTSPSVGACTTCHTGYKRHAGKVACITCHTNPAKFHHGTAKRIAKTCRSCHAVTHARRAVAGSKCTVCHKGNAPASRPRVQHSSTITKRKTCSACHAQKVHAKALKSSMTCQSCHKGPYHAWQKIPGRTLCLSCHSSASRHSAGLSCLLCHRSQIHDPDPRP
jgi:hypothetical protein